MRGGLTRPTRPDDRQALLGILFVLKTGIAWEDLPCELGCGSGMTCWRRLRDWQADGTRAKVHEVPLARLHAAGNVGRSRAAVDPSSVRAAFGGRTPGGARRTAGSREPSTTCS